MSYKHLTLKEIAKIVGVHPLTISLELKRGRGTKGKEYWVIASQKFYVSSKAFFSLFSKSFSLTAIRTKDLSNP